MSTVAVGPLGICSTCSLVALIACKGTHAESLPASEYGTNKYRYDKDGYGETKVGPVESVNSDSFGKQSLKVDAGS